MTAGVQQGPYDKLYSLAFIGENATIVTDRNSYRVFPEWDDENGRFTNSKKANALIKPEYSAPWTFPII
jgi:hypothetical protein